MAAFGFINVIEVIREIISTPIMKRISNHHPIDPTVWYIKKSNYVPHEPDCFNVLFRKIQVYVF